MHKNEIIIIETLRHLTAVNDDLSKFSKVLYQENHCLELYKYFRKLYESVSMVSNSIYMFESED